jgi:two-component sensor histidine kinase
MHADAAAKAGLGTSIVNALAQQLDQQGQKRN